MSNDDDMTSAERRLANMAVAANQYQGIVQDIWMQHRDYTVPILITMCGNTLLAMESRDGCMLADPARVTAAHTAELFELAEDLVTRGPSSIMILFYAMAAAMENKIKEAQLSQQADAAATKPL